jgi:hypothetical protein
MKANKFWVPMFEWTVTVLEVESTKDYKLIDKILKKSGVHEESRERVKDDIIQKRVNGGDHFYSIGSKWSIVVLGAFTSDKQRNHILCHEKRHVEDRILDTYNMRDIEAAGMLAGYLGKKMI